MSIIVEAMPSKPGTDVGGRTTYLPGWQALVRGGCFSIIRTRVVIPGSAVTMECCDDIKVEAVAGLVGDMPGHVKGRVHSHQLLEHLLWKPPGPSQVRYAFSKFSKMYALRLGDSAKQVPMKPRDEAGGIHATRPSRA